MSGNLLPAEYVLSQMSRMVANDGGISAGAVISILECVSKFIRFMITQANTRCMEQKRTTITGEDVLIAMNNHGFYRYIGPLFLYLNHFGRTFWSIGRRTKDTCTGHRLDPPTDTKLKDCIVLAQGYSIQFGRKVGSDRENPVYTTPAAMRIAERYAAILERMPEEVTQTGDRDEPWDWWMEALEVPQGTRPKKDYVVGFPNARATDLLHTLATWYRDSTRNEVGSSSSAPRQREAIPGNVYLAIVSNVLTKIRANPNRFARQFFDAEIATFARTALEASDPSSDPSQRLQWNNLIVQKTEARVAEENNRRAMEVDMDYTSEDETSDDEDFDDDDLISPYIYIMCAYGLSSSIRKIEEDTKIEADVMKSIMDMCENISGKTIWYAKSSIIFSLNISPSNKVDVCEQLGVKEVHNRGVTTMENEALSKPGKVTLLKMAAWVVLNFWMRNLLPAEYVLSQMSRMVANDRGISAGAVISIQECVSKFIRFMTTQANTRCMEEKRTTITGEDVLIAMNNHGFYRYIGPLYLYLNHFRAYGGDEHPG
ncbi:hypothetical protein AgCh_039612 [Apium graveolens]